jgi:hypothetical protein
MWSTSLNRLFPQEKAYIANPGHMTSTVLLLYCGPRSLALCGFSRMEKHRGEPGSVSAFPEGVLEHGSGI